MSFTSRVANERKQENISSLTKATEDLREIADR